MEFENNPAPQDEEALTPQQPEEIPAAEAPAEEVPVEETLAAEAPVEEFRLQQPLEQPKQKKEAGRAQDRRRQVAVLRDHQHQHL